LPPSSAPASVLGTAVARSPGALTATPGGGPAVWTTPHPSPGFTGVLAPGGGFKLPLSPAVTAPLRPNNGQHPPATAATAPTLMRPMVSPPAPSSMLPGQPLDISPPTIPSSGDTTSVQALGLASALGMTGPGGSASANAVLPGLPLAGVTPPGVGGTPASVLPPVQPLVGLPAGLGNPNLAPGPAAQQLAQTMPMGSGFSPDVSGALLQQATPKELARPMPAFRSSFVMGRPVVGKAPSAGQGLPEGAVAAFEPAVAQVDLRATRFDVGEIMPGLPPLMEVPSTALALAVPSFESPTMGVSTAGLEMPKKDDAARQRVEDALDLFLARLPAWRGGQRDVGQTPLGESLEGEDATNERWWRREKERSRSRSRRRPSPVPAPPRKGSMFDIGPQKALPPLPKKEKKKDKDRDRDRDRRERREERSRSGSRASSRGRSGSRLRRK